MSFLLRAVYYYCVKNSVFVPWYVPDRFAWRFSRRCILLQMYMENTDWIRNRVPMAQELRSRREELKRFIKYVTTMTLNDKTRTFH